MSQSLKNKYSTNEEENLGKADGIIANVAGIQATATALTKKWNEINTNVADDGAVKLAAGLIGYEQNVFNNTTQILKVFPIAGESINSITNFGFRISPNSNMTFRCVRDGVWMANGNSI